MPWLGLRGYPGNSGARQRIFFRAAGEAQCAKLCANVGTGRQAGRPAGRAGRGDRPGRVVIQTYVPEHYAVQAAAAHDYDGFYAREIEYRRQLGNPPFSQLCRLIFSHRGEAFAAEEARRLRQTLDREIASRGLEGISVIGPAPAFITRRRGRYRWVLLLRGVRVQRLLEDTPLPRGWTVNVDPLGLA